MKAKIVYTPTTLNFSLFAIGMLGLWISTQSWAAMGWAALASLHFTFSVRQPS